MEGKVIFLILALFMGVSVAYGPPGLFRDRTAPDKWSTLRKMKDERNQPERRKLPYRARGTGMTFVKDEVVEYVDYCNKITLRNVNKVKEHPYRWGTYTGTVEEETRCTPYLQPCNSDSHYNLYCHTVEVEQKVNMDCVLGRCLRIPRMMNVSFTLKVGVGCECRQRKDDVLIKRKRQKFGDDAV